jgi:hypothetical protein
VVASNLFANDIEVHGDISPLSNVRFHKAHHHIFRHSLTCCPMWIFSQLLKAVQHVQLHTLSLCSLHQVDQSRLKGAVPSIGAMGKDIQQMTCPPKMGYNSSSVCDIKTLTPTVC